MIDVTLPDRAHIIVIGRPHLDRLIRPVARTHRAIQVTDNERGLSRMRGLGAHCPLVIIRERAFEVPEAIAVELEHRLAILRHYAEMDALPVVEWTC